MKVLIIANMYPSSDKPYAGIFVKNQFEYLKSNFKDVSVDLYAMPRRITNLPGSIKKYTGAFLGFISRLFKRYDIIHVHYFFPLFLLAYWYKLFHPRTKIVVTFHGSDINKYLKNAQTRFICRKLIPKADYLIAVGKELANNVEQCLGIKINQVLPAGVDRSVFYPEKNIEKKYNFIFTGSFISRKGIDLLIKVVPLMGKNVHWCFVGSGPYIEALEKLLENFSIEIIQNASQEKLRELYNKAFYFVLPSRDEPFGLVATEAMYCGTPCIVSSNGGLREQVQDNYNGFVINELTVENIKEVLQKAMGSNQERYNQLSVNASTSGKNYSLEYVCNETVKVYSYLINTGNIS